MPPGSSVILVLAAAVAAFWLVGRYSNSRALAALHWNGPYPHETELKSSYYRRKALFALKCLLLIAAVAGCLSLVSRSVPITGTWLTVRQVVALFLFFFFGMAFLGVVAAAFTSFKASAFGPNPIILAEWRRAREEFPPPEA